MFLAQELLWFSGGGRENKCWKMKITKAIFVKSAKDLADYPSGGFAEVAFAGRSNVGKSSMINCLVQKRGLAHTSSTPGKTRLINFYLVNGEVSFADLPGYGYARVSREMRSEWKRMVEEYFLHRKELRLLILVVDVRRGLEEDEKAFLLWLKQRGIKAVIVGTKIDKLNRSERVRAMRILREQAKEFGMDVFEFSSRSGEGRDELWSRIVQVCGEGSWSFSGENFFSQ